VVEGVDFTAYSGEVLGLAGLTGSGREQILRLLFGALPRTGEVLVDGKPARPRPAAAVASGMALVPADRTGSGSIIDLTVRENFVLGDLKRHSGVAAHLSKTEERAEVRDWIKELDVRPPRPEAVFDSLSGGNQQKVVLAKWLRMKPRVILLDEPTQGVDVQAKATIHALARKAAAEGAAVVIASSDDPELCDTCDRVLVMRDGHFVGELTRADLNPERISTIQLGGAAVSGTHA
jgi:ribose transport system ATP-binding protein